MAKSAATGTWFSVGIVNIIHFSSDSMHLKVSLSKIRVDEDSD
jgi:hypothetical protein